jgi:N-methylhydantoinase B
MLMRDPATSFGQSKKSAFSDPVLAAVLANRFESIVREMTNTVLKTARSAVISSGRDFSCSLVTADNQLLTVADGLPVHTFSSHLQTSSMAELHDDMAEGDAYLHNDPYMGNTHAADQSILIPVYAEGEHLFTAVAKAHQADIGNSLPTTYHAYARDVYEEGALIFPCVRVQKNYRMKDDIVRMCMRRIRVPEQWRGDFLATLGAGRIAERRLKEMCAKYGVATIKSFISEWFDYSEMLIASRIAKLPASKLRRTGRHDPVGTILPEGIPLNVGIEIDPKEQQITIDLRDNIDCVPAGFNQTEATAVNNVTNGVYNVLGPGVPRNSGAFRRIKVLLRENSVAGIPRFPASCSIATTNVGDRLVNMVQSSFADLGEGFVSALPKRA